MSRIVLNAIAEERATLERIVPTPTPPFGYGRDLSCTTDVTPTWEEVDPFSERAIWEASLRRITTERGELPDGGDPEDLEYGRDVRRLLHRGLTPAQIRDEAGQLQAELTKDDRVESASVTLRQLSLKELHVEISITPVGADRSFTKTLAVTPEVVREL